MRVKFVGTGDAFGSGGRFNTCFLVEARDRQFLIDCGASSMVALRRLKIDPNTIDVIIISHLHGDHFGGIPFFILDGQLVSRRRKPLVLVGPPGFAKRVAVMMEACFPGSSTAARKFSTDYVELVPGGVTEVGGLKIRSAPVVHPSGDTPTLALRIECEDKIVAYTADTEWTDALVEIGRAADLLIAEAYTREKKVRYHLDLASLVANL